MSEAATTLPAPLDLTPVQVRKDRFVLGDVPMPGDPTLCEGSVNRLKIQVSYLKDGMGRQGRGIYFVVTGHAFDGTFESHMLMQDPSEYMLVEPLARFSAKKLAAVAETASTTLADKIALQVEAATHYYERKGR